MPTDGGEHIAERRVRLGIPGGLLDRNAAIRMQCMSQEDYETVQPEEARGAAFNRQVRPLALRFDSQMRPTLLEGHFDGPAFDEVFYDLCCALRLIGREVRFWFPLALRITREHPANRQRVGPRRIPQRGARHDFELALSPPVPSDGERFPCR